MYIRSIPKRGIIMLLWSLVLVFTGLFVWLLLQACEPFDFLDELIAAIAVGIFTLYGWYTVLLEVNSWEIQPGAIHVRDLAGIRTRSFQPFEIIRWAEKQKSNKYSNWNELHVHTASGKFRLLSSAVRNYEDLKHAILKNAPMNPLQEERAEPSKALRPYVATGFILVAAGTAWAVYDIRTPDPPIATACIDAVLSAAPVPETGSENTAWMQFPVRQYPALHFSVADNDGSYQSAAVSELRTNFRAGDSLTLCIDTSDYNLYIAMTRAPRFWERATGYGSIRLLGIRTADRIYLDPANIHAWNNGEPGPWILPLLIGVMFIVIAVAFHRHNRQA
jgi:hypothetical protein